MLEYMGAKLLQSCQILCNPMDYSPLDSSVHGILQARILEWIARESSPPRGTIMSPALAGWFFTTSTTWEELLLHIFCKITITTNNLTCIDFQHFSQATGTQIKHRNLCTGFTTIQFPSLPPSLALNMACKFFHTSLPTLSLNLYYKFIIFFELPISSSIQEEKFTL